nr:RNA-directed DNA polymerase, eukaryota, reverse transcriptase zinc-binding domain protein [Tanacetum cinerariifolium]
MKHGFLSQKKSEGGRGVKEKDLNRNKKNTSLSICVTTKSNDTMNNDTPIGVAFAIQEGVTPSMVGLTAGNAPGKSSYANITGKASTKKVNVRTLFTPRDLEAFIVDSFALEKLLELVLDEGNKSKRKIYILNKHENTIYDLNTNNEIRSEESKEQHEIRVLDIDLGDEEVIGADEVSENAGEGLAFADSLKKISCTNEATQELSNVSDKVKMTYAKVIGLKNIMLDKKLCYVSTIVCENGSDVVIFDEELMNTCSAKWNLTDKRVEKNQQQENSDEEEVMEDTG